MTPSELESVAISLVNAVHLLKHVDGKTDSDSEAIRGARDHVLEIAGKLETRAEREDGPEWEDIERLSLRVGRLEGMIMCVGARSDGIIQGLESTGGADDHHFKFAEMIDALQRAAKC